MKVPCLIMAGGIGKRMSLSSEKPMLQFLGKPLIDWVAEAVATAKNVSEFYIVTSDNTSETEQHCRTRGWRILRTTANTGKGLDKIISEFEFCKKDFLAVFVPIRAREDAGLSISSIDEYNGVWYAVSGINIINGTKIQSEGKIETSAVISEETEFLLNINTIKDLEIAEKIMTRAKRF